MTEQPKAPLRTIRDTNALIRALVEQETVGYPFWVGGYVTRCFVSDFGHVYFDLTDDDHAISCFIRESVRGSLEFPISNGMDIEVLGTVRVYERQARVQIEVEKVRLIERSGTVPDTTVLEQLEREGVLPKTKRPLPNQLRSIGLITSRHSEALHDFEDTLRKEGSIASIRLIEARIQGKYAGSDIAHAINRFNRERNVDVIALIRGGGRVADLAIFNDYKIARAICTSTIPLVTGIGHQRDETVADQVADVREITPTAAAIRLARHSQPAQSAQTKPSGITPYLIGVIAVLLIAGLLLLLIARQ